ncbi:hypothetical protein BGX34_001003, partial [Mortierella sp. NVP85]
MPTKIPTHLKDARYQTLRDRVAAAAYIDLGKLLERQRYQTGSQEICKKAGVEGMPMIQVDPQPAIAHNHSEGHRFLVRQNVVLSSKNVPPPAIELTLPEQDGRLSSISTGLVSWCVTGHTITRYTGTNGANLTEGRQKGMDKQDRLGAMEAIRAFKRDEPKDANTITEVICLGHVINKYSFQDLLREFYSGIDHLGLLNIHQLNGMAGLMQGGAPGCLDTGDLVKIQRLLSNRLRDTPAVITPYASADTGSVAHPRCDVDVKDLDRGMNPLAVPWRIKSLDPYLIYQAVYANQAILCVPDDETTWQSVMRRIQEEFAGPSNVMEATTMAYDKATTPAQSRQSFMNSLKEGLGFDLKRDWYSALRGADALIRDEELTTFNELANEDEKKRTIYQARRQRGPKPYPLKVDRVQNRICRHTLNGHNSAGFSVAYSPKGDQIASGNCGYTLRQWDVSSGHGMNVLSVKSSPGGDQLATGSEDEEIRLWGRLLRPAQT